MTFFPVHPAFSQISVFSLHTPDKPEYTPHKVNQGGGDGDQGLGRGGLSPDRCPQPKPRLSSELAGRFSLQFLQCCLQAH